MLYRKKPVVIEAMQWDGTREGWVEITQWADDVWFIVDGAIEIKTLEGTMRVDPSDWVIRGVQGEFYPCKPDIFDATYEPVDPVEVPAQYGGDE